MRRRLLWVAVWLLGAVALGVGLWPSRYRPWPLPYGMGCIPVPGSHHVDCFPTATAGDQSPFPVVRGAWERWDLDTGTSVSTGPDLPAYRYDSQYGFTGPNTAQVRPADEPDDTPLRLIELPSGRELGRHQVPAHLFAIGEPADGLYAVGLPASSASRSPPNRVTSTELAGPWQVHIHEAGTGRRLRSLPGAVCYNPVVSGRLLVTITPREGVPEGTPRTVHVWDVTDGRQVGTIPVGPFSATQHQLLLSGNGRYLFCVSGQVWEVATGAVVRPTRSYEMMTALTGDGRWLLQANDYAVTTAWFDSDTGTERIDSGSLPMPSYGSAGGGSFSMGRWGNHRMFVTRAFAAPPGQVKRWLTSNMPSLFPPVTGYDWYDFRILDPATGQAVLTAPVFATQGTDDGALLFVYGPDGQQRLYFTGRLIPWVAALAVVGWSLLLFAVCRWRRRRPASSHRPLTPAARFPDASATTG